MFLDFRGLRSSIKSLKLYAKCCVHKQTDVFGGQKVQSIESWNTVGNQKTSEGGRQV